MPVVNGIYLKDFPTLGRSPLSTDLIPIAYSSDNVAYKATLAQLLALGSVGLTMPSAFSVANSPVQGTGTLAVTAAGVASQYIRGDGTLGDFPSNGGGGSSVSYYLNGSVSQGTIGGNAYKEMNKTPVVGTGTDFTINADGYIAQFITDANDPASLLIPGGNWNVEMYFSASSSGGTPSFYVELYKYDGSTFTLLGSSSATPEGITNGTAIDIYYTSLAVPETVLTLTDRLAIRVYVTPSGRTITLHTEDNHLSEIVTTFSNGLTALNGLTKQTQYFAVGTTGTDFAISSSVDTHTFNLPTASATNRGALSSADWTTFNNKQNAISLTTTGSSGASTFIADVLNVPNYTLSGLGGVPTSRQLTINGTAYDLSADRTWSVGTVTSVAAITLGTTGTDLSSTVATGTTTPVITLQVPTASATNRGALSSADWTTFNSKQNTITLTTTGTSGAATFIANTLNIPQYQASGTYVTSVTGTSPIVSSGGTTPAISIPVATTSVNGYLSSTDWTTFNNKQATITLTTTGTSGAATFVANTLNIPNYADGGVLSLSAIGSTPNANAATITGTVLNLQPADASFGGVVTTGTQTFAGAKTFSAITTISNATASTSTTTGGLVVTGGVGIGGALFGTSATFSGSGLPLTLTTSASRTDQLVATQGAFTQKAHFGSFSGNTYLSTNWYYNGGQNYDDNTLKSSSIVLNADGSINLNTNNVANTVPSTALTIAATGAATFSSRVNVNGATDNSSYVIQGKGNVSSIDSNNQNTVFLAASPTASYLATSWIGGGGAVPLYIQNNGINSITVSTTGNVGIGTTSPSDILHITKTSGANRIRLESSFGLSFVGYDGAINGMQLATQGSLLFQTGSSYVEAMRITSGGNVLIGTTTDNGYRLQVVGSGSVASFNDTSSGDENIRFLANGTFRGGLGADANYALKIGGTGGIVAVINTSTGAYTATSDRTLKKNISDSPLALPVLNQIKIRQYNWKSDDSVEQYGVIAQELYEVAPTYVSKPKKETDKWGVSKAELVPLLIKAIQEQTQIIKDLEARIMFLENK